MQNGQPRTLNELIMQATTRRINKVVMRFKRDNDWQNITGAELMERIRQVALALREHGVQPGDRVSILAESCPEWSITDYAILASGGVTVPIYPTQAVDQVAFILRAGFDALDVTHPGTVAALRAGQIVAVNRHYQPASRETAEDRPGGRPWLRRTTGLAAGV